VTIGLGLDGGGSATRWALADASGAVLARGEGPAVSGLLFGAEARAAFAAAAGTIAAALPVRPGRVLAGITGLAPGTEAAEAALGLAQAAVAIDDDIHIAFRATFAPGTGHVVYAGTGSIGLHLAAEGSAIRVGGRGMLIDDAGSAFWIGRTALDRVWRARDADPGFTSPLAAALDGAIGGAGWDRHRQYVYGGGRNAVAQLARAIATAPDAEPIFRQAGAELGRLARALAARAGPRPVALIGRAAGLHPAIAEGVRAVVPGMRVALASPDAALAAARLAAGAVAVHASAQDKTQDKTKETP
jgi:N-acetylglucosamine kinase-like BadF-type ATPase